MDLEVLKKMTCEEQQEAIHAVENFIEDLNKRSLHDAWCLEMAADVAARIKAYEDAVSGLTPEQRETIEDYIAACEDFEYSHVYIAYTLGREHQRLGIPSPLFMGYL